jgi:RNA polymerase sigma-70 factor, ECF subfamily
MTTFGGRLPHRVKMGTAVMTMRSAEASRSWPRPARDGVARDPHVDGAALDFDGIFRRYAPYVARVGFRLLGQDDELQDLVQDVFLEAHRGLARVSDSSAIKAWLARITVRKAVRRLRKQRLWQVLHLRLPSEFSDLSAPTANPEERAQVAGVYRALATLPTKTRAAWLLKHLEGESLDAISDALGISKSTVQRRLSDAQSKLRGLAGGPEGGSRE